MYIPMVKCKDGEAQAILHYWSPVKKSMEGFYYRQIHKMSLMELMEDKYWNWPLGFLCEMKEEVKAGLGTEIGRILNGFTDGEVW